MPEAFHAIGGREIVCSCSQVDWINTSLELFFCLNTVNIVKQKNSSPQGMLAAAPAMCALQDLP